MNKIIKNSLILTAITVVSGLLLGVVYNVTKEPIAQAQENTKQEAYRAVLADASSFETLDFDAESTLSLLTENGYTSDTITEVAEGKDNSGETIGYVISVQSSEAYDGTLDLSVGIATDGTVKGVEMLSISETAGLGMKADTEEFKGQFAGKNVEEFQYTKNGASADNEIDALSGATITTNAMTNGVNAGLCAFREAEKGGNE